VLTCQRLGRRVLLIIRASGAAEVAGNTDYGLPGQSGLPYGPYYATGGLTFNETTGADEGPLPNLFDAAHPSSAFALTIFSLFGEGHTERDDLRPLGPDTPNAASADGISWSGGVSKPLGEEVVVDGFDVQVPVEWKGTYQGRQFQELVTSLREMVKGAYDMNRGQRAGVDAGAAGPGIVVQSWV
jgi:hypothetical protein